VTADASVTIDDSAGTDKLRFKDLESARTVTLYDLMFQRSGDDLVITLDGYQGQTVISFFYGDDETYHIERIYDENEEAPTGYSLEIDAVLNLSNGDSPISGADLWEV
jgi:hypothetical protein